MKHDEGGIRPIGSYHVIHYDWFRVKSTPPGAERLVGRKDVLAETPTGTRGGTRGPAPLCGRFAS